MADTADRRSLVLSKERTAVRQRMRYRKLKAMGFCTNCARTEVRNRTLCYRCVDRKNAAQGSAPAQERLS